MIKKRQNENKIEKVKKEKHKPYSPFRSLHYSLSLKFSLTLLSLKATFGCKESPPTTTSKYQLTKPFR